MIFVDASMLKDWLTCRELFRLRWIENLRPIKMGIPILVGSSFHAGIEQFWRGEDYHTAMRVAMKALDIDESGLNQPERERLQEAREYMPDMLEVYFTEQDYVPGSIWRTPLNSAAVEWEFGRILPQLPDITLCGKLDRVEVGPIIYDCKTASEIGKNWKHDYREMLLRDIQFQLYDFYLTSIGHPPIMSVVEVITKPYRGKPPKFYRIELPELASYRARFKQQLDWILKEMVHYVTRYQEARPWPMAAATTCVGKYGPCDYIELCNRGSNAKTMAQFRPREEHLVSITERVTTA